MVQWLCNSNLFAHGIFRMELSTVQLQEFNSTRFTSSFVFENIPQMIIQIWFIAIIGEFDEPTLVAFLSSVIAIIMGLVDVWSSRKISSAVKNHKKYGNTTIPIEIIIDTNDELYKNKSIIKQKPKALAEAIGETMAINSNSIEIWVIMLMIV